MFLCSMLPALLLLACFPLVLLQHIQVCQGVQAFADTFDDAVANRGINRIARCGKRGCVVDGFGDFGILLFRLLFRWINLALRAGRLRRIVALLTTLRGLADRTPIGAPPSDDAGGNWAPRS
ncbi:hypothetical protein CSQ94_13840 [Janthinobacterium sp. BJB312]|nr:hypothetical protein CSQ94_13840 [Janthinobacterium sp. BJB312]